MDYSTRLENGPVTGAIVGLAVTTTSCLHIALGHIVSLLWLRLDGPLLMRLGRLLSLSQSRLWWSSPMNPLLEELQDIIDQSEEYIGNIERKAGVSKDTIYRWINGHPHSGCVGTRG